MESNDDLRRICQEWERFTQTGQLDDEVIRPEVAASWRRCAGLGVDPFAPKPPVKLNLPQLAERKAGNRLLLDTALPFMEFLRNAVRGTGFILVITDAAGVVLEVFGDDDILEMARGNNYVPGCSREEAAVGTNAVGLALWERKPVQLTGAEHWNQRHHRWTCVSAPVFGPDHEVLGTVTLSGESLSSHRHTFGMVISAAEAIQARLSEREATRCRSWLDAMLASILDSVADGFIVIDAAGQVTNVNAAAARLLGIRADQALGTSVLRLFPAHPELMRVLESGKETAPIEVATESARGPFVITPYLMQAEGSPRGAFLLVRERKEFLNDVREITGFEALIHFEDIVGRSPALMRQIELARIASRRNSRILITGETGTGKELFAQAIHNASPRSRGPFVALNCAAIPRELLESELFGYKGGAFTGARKGGQVGKLELADGGTMFLDEINQLPLDLQAKLLRVLQDGSVLRLGDTKPIRVDLRIIAATNEDLYEKSVTGGFRLDLYFRLSVVEINLPPLRERTGDLPLLAGHIIDRLSEKLDTGPLALSPQALERLCDHPWPGNVRELENVLEMAAIVCQGPTIEPAHLAYRMKGPARQTAAAPAKPAVHAPALPGAAPEGPGAGAEPAAPQMQPMKDAEIELIRTAMKQYGGNIALAARQLGISRSTIYRRLKEHGITKLFQFE